MTSGELEGARRKGWNGEEGGSGRRCTSLSLLSTIHIRGSGPTMSTMCTICDGALPCRDKLV